MVNETVNQTLNTTLTNDVVADVSYNILSYFGGLPEQVMQGNVIAIAISLVLFFVFLVVANAIASVLLSFLKRTILFIIVVLVILDFIPKYMQLVQLQGWTIGTILMGLAAFSASGLALFMASKSLLKSAKDQFHTISDKLKERQDHETEAMLLRQKEKEVAEAQKQAESMRGMFNRENIGNEKSLLAVLIYLIVAEFGVFSSPTLSAPNVQVGVMFFAIFIVGIIIFAKSSYKNIKTAAMYVSVTFVVGIVLSFILGILWGTNTLQELLSPSFFTSDSLVAMITGMGVSLFAGSKG